MSTRTGLSRTDCTKRTWRPLLATFIYCGVLLCSALIACSAVNFMAVSLFVAGWNVAPTQTQAGRRAARNEDASAVGGEESSDANVEGLASILKDAHLQQYVAVSSAWCAEQGADSLEDILENLDDFCKGLALLPEEVANLERVIAARSGLHRLAEAGDVGALRNLMGATSLELADSGGRRPIHLAVSGGHLSAASLLLENGCSPNPRDAGGRTPLHTAAFAGHLPLLELLLDKNARTDVVETRIESTPLHSASRNGHVAATQLLLDRGAWPHSKDTIGRDALHWACFWGHRTVVQILLEAGLECGLSNLDRGSGASALHWAAWRGHTDVVQLLISKGADSDMRSLQGMTVLHYAAEGGHAAVSKQLLQLGVDPEALTEHGESPLLLAKYRTERGHAGPGGDAVKGGNHTEVVQLLEGLRSARDHVAVGGQ